MDIRIVIGITVALVLIAVFFGRNPLERPEGYVPPDPFKEGIESRLNGPTPWGKPGAFSGGATSYGTPPSAPAPAPATPFGQAAPAPASTSVPLTPAPAQQEAPSQPTPFQQLPMPGAPRSSLAPQALPTVIPAFNLPNGQKVEFSGAQVYKIDTSGKRVPLADGKYQVSGRTIYVRGGKQQFPPDYFAKRMFEREEPAS